MVFARWGGMEAGVVWRTQSSRFRGIGARYDNCWWRTIRYRRRSNDSYLTERRNVDRPRVEFHLWDYWDLRREWDHCSGGAGLRSLLPFHLKDFIRRHRVDFSRNKRYQRK